MTRLTSQKLNYSRWHFDQDSMIIEFVACLHFEGRWDELFDGISMSIISCGGSGCFSHIWATEDSVVEGPVKQRLSVCSCCNWHVAKVILWSVDTSADSSWPILSLKFVFDNFSWAAAISIALPVFIIVCRHSNLIHSNSCLTSSDWQLWTFFFLKQSQDQETLEGSYSWNHHIRSFSAFAAF